MRENTNRSWSTFTGISFLGRLKHKVNQKVDKYFVNHFFSEAPEQAPPPPPPTYAAAQGQSWGASGHGQFDYNEASGSNHTSTQNSEYFDATDGREYIQQHQIPGAAWHDWNSRPSLVPASTGHHQELPGMYIVSQQLDQRDGIHQHLPTSHDQSFLRDFDRELQQAPMSVDEYDIPSESLAEISELVSDAEREWQRDERVNHNYSRRYGAPSMSMHEMSGDTGETMDSNVADTGDSNFSYILPPHPEPHHRSVIKEYIDYARRLLLEDDLVKIRRFRVVASIVYVYRKLRMLVRRKRTLRCNATRSGPWSYSVERSGTHDVETPNWNPNLTPSAFQCKEMQRCTSSTVSGEGSGSGKLKRIRSGECKYQGIKKRKGKWVAEIRVSKTKDKVWLGSFPTEKEAALAYDAGLHHCSIKRNKVFNFKDSPKNLGHPQYGTIFAMSKEDRKTRVQTLASEYAMAYGSSNTIR